MNLRVFNKRFLEPGTMLVMILGILFLCQPWSAVLHEWSVLVMIIGLIGFTVAVHIPPPEPGAQPGDDVEPATPHEVIKGLSDG